MSTAKIQPLADKVLIKPAAKEEVTKSGIVLADTGSKDRPQMGEVLAVGEGHVTPEGKLLPMHVKVGQKVYFTKYGPTEVEVEGQEYLVVEEKDILAIIS
jgi:chaperonin GroES